MQLNSLPQSSLALEPAIDYHPLTVSPDTPLLEILALMSQLRSSCDLPGWNSGSQTNESPLINPVDDYLRRDGEKVLASVAAVEGCVLVTEGTQLIGVFTDRDIVKLTAAGASLVNVKIAEVVTQPAITLRHSEAQDIFTALGLFRQHRIRHLPIVDDLGQLIGLVTHDSVRRALQPVTLLTRLRYVIDVMTSQVVHAPMTASVLDLAQLMAQQCVSCVVITEVTAEQAGKAGFSSPQSKIHRRASGFPQGNPLAQRRVAQSKILSPVGIVTERDIVQFRALELDLSKLQAQDAMSTPLFCLRSTDSLWVAHQEMQRRRVRRLVVTGSEGELLGIVSQTSLLQVLNPADMYSVIEVLQQAVEERTSALQKSNEQLRHEVLERQRAEQELQKAHDNLKKQVDERTAELAKTNAQLQKDILERMAAEIALRQSETQLRSQATQLEETIHQLQKTQAQLIQTEKMSSLGQLVAGVAHEINNPINFIYGNLTYAGQYVQDLLKLLQLYTKHYPEPVVEIQKQTEVIDLDFLKIDLPKLLGSMKLGADRIRDLVLSLRNFSRLDEAEMKTVNIHQGLDNTLLILQNQLKARAGRPEIEIIKEYGNLPLVECHAGQLNQVFMNVLSNAIDALTAIETWKVEKLENPQELKNWKVSKLESLQDLSSLQMKKLESADKPINLQTFKSANSVESTNSSELSNLPTPTIRIRTEVVGNNQVAIWIADNGAGMTEAVCRHLFDPFFTTKPVGKGTGLGLSISYQIVVEKHSGQLRCVSVPGQGAEFIIEIPIRQSHPSTGLATA